MAGIVVGTALAASPHVGCDHTAVIDLRAVAGLVCGAVLILGGERVRGPVGSAWIEEPPSLTSAYAAGSGRGRRLAW